jgi:NAD(P)H-dependent FMN reductase
MYIPIILGTSREGRESEKVARYMIGEVEKFGLETELIDVRNFIKSGSTDNAQQTSLAAKYSEKITKADGIIIVSPEYNHGYPGELKLLLDTLYQQYARKPVGICGVSGGSLGGARMIEQLRLVMIELRMVPIREAIYFSNIDDLFDEKNNIQNNSYKNKIKNFLEELTWYADALKSAREKNSKGRLSSDK